MNKKVKIKVPARIHIDCLDIHSLTKNVGKIAGGGIGIAVKMETYMTAEIIDNSIDIIDARKNVLVQYILDVMREILNVTDHYKICIDLDERMKKHSGLASNAVVLTGIIKLINELYNNPLTEEELIKIFQENYAEQEKQKITKNVLCSGVANNTVMHGGICFVDENGKLMYSHKCPQNMKICVIKSSCEDICSEGSLNYDEAIVKHKFKDGADYSKFSKIKANYIRDFIIPELKKENYIPFFKGIRFFGENDDSSKIAKICKINNEPLNDFKKNFYDIDNFVIRVSSSSSHVCIITDEMDKVAEICDKNEIEYNIYEIENNGVEIIEE